MMSPQRALKRVCARLCCAVRIAEAMNIKVELTTGVTDLDTSLTDVD